MGTFQISFRIRGHENLHEISWKLLRCLDIWESFRVFGKFLRWGRLLSILEPSWDIFVCGGRVEVSVPVAVLHLVDGVRGPVDRAVDARVTSTIGK